MFSNSDSGYWALTPELQKKFDEIQARTRRLQIEMGIKPMTLEQRAAAYDQRRKQEAEFKAVLSTRRPIPKWKV